MTPFLAMAALVFAVGAGLLTRPLWWRAGGRLGGALNRDVESLSLQLRQLAALHAGGALTDEQFAASKSLIERKLIDALVPQAGADPAGPALAPARASVRLAMGLLAFMLAIAAGGYALVGSPRDLAVGPGANLARSGTDDAAPGDAASAPHDLTAAQINDMVARLAERLKTHPDDAEGWMMLARSQVALGQHAQAIDAFAHAERLRPDDARLLADYADALAMAHERSLEGQPSVLLQRALKVDPHNDKALALAGTAAFDRKDYKQAVRYWETLKLVEPAGGPFSDQLQGGIAEARKLGGMPPADPADGSAGAEPASGTTTSTTTLPAGNATVSGTVTLAKSLSSRADPDDVLFVFARAVGGSRMPLAILRKRVKDLPLSFTLDDSLAMSPEATLSSVPKVIVGARISKSGNAMAQDGDLQGLGSAVAVGATGVHVEINEQVAR